MRINAISAVLLVIAIASIASAWLMPANPKSGLLFDKNGVNLGEIRQNDSFDIDFQFTNLFSTPIREIRIQTSCSCMTSDVNATTLAPHETGRIRLKWNSGVRSGESQDAVTIYYEVSGKVYFSKLSIESNVLPEFQLQPEKCQISPEDRETVITLQPRALDDARIETVENSCASLDVTVTQDRRRISVKLVPDAKQSGRQLLTIKTNSARQPFVNFEVFIHSVPSTGLRHDPSNEMPRQLPQPPGV